MGEKQEFFSFFKSSHFFFKKSLQLWTLTVFIEVAEANLKEN